jgi:hypothetical protein
VVRQTVHLHKSMAVRHTIDFDEGRNAYISKHVPITIKTTEPFSSGVVAVGLMDRPGDCKCTWTPAGGTVSHARFALKYPSRSCWHHYRFCRSAGL